MIATAFSATLLGLQAHPVRVEVQAMRGPPFFELVGLAEASVRESRVRVKSALASVGIDISECRIIVNLAPADVKKSGSGFDLAIAAAVLGAMGAAPRDALRRVLLVGELSLEGTVQPLRGVLAHLLGARAQGLGRAIVPQANSAEATLVDGIDVRTVGSLRELYDALRGRTELPTPAGVMRSEREGEATYDLADVRGQVAARRAVEVAGAGDHNLLMIGPPGVGKTMIARRLPGLLPPMAIDEALEVTAIHSVAGLLAGAGGLSLSRPFRAPHHTVTGIGLVGGGSVPRPGEVSLAHRGVLFLDEIAEFRRSSLEALREPLEDGVVTVSRASATAVFPARFLLVCASNQCGCGFLGDGSGRCGCSAEAIRAYRARMSGPILDRIDVHVVLPPVDVHVLDTIGEGESSAAVRGRIEKARDVQRRRRECGEVRGATNATLGPRDLERVAKPCAAGSRLLSAAVQRLALSARAYGKVLRVARTIADLEGSDGVQVAHVAEAIAFRVLDRRSQLAAA
jgi:magnesium chelatase family protein